MLAVIETHPVQYHAPVYRALQQEFNIPVTAIYGSDFSIVGFRDREFGATFAWDTDLLSGYASIFLSSDLPGTAYTRAPGLRRALQRIAPDAVLLVGYSPRFYQRALVAAWRTGRPLLLRAETADHARRRGAPKSVVRDCLLRLVYGACNRLLYVGEQSYRHYRRLGCTDAKLVFSPYCVDTQPFQTDEAARRRLRQHTRAELGIDPNAKVVLFSGKLVPRKRADLLVQSIQLLAPEYRQDTCLLMLGDGEMRGLLAAEADAARPSVRIKFVGFQNQTRLSAFYHAADLLVLPSESQETWGLVVNEALHHGVPSVVSDSVGCAFDLIQPGVTGERFRTGSAEDLASALTRAWPLIDNPPARDRCRDKVAGYSVSKAAEGLARAYLAATHAA